MLDKTPEGAGAAPPSGPEAAPLVKPRGVETLTATEWLARHGYGDLKGPGGLMKLALALRESRAPP